MIISIDTEKKTFDKSQIITKTFNKLGIERNFLT